MGLVKLYNTESNQDLLEALVKITSILQKYRNTQPLILETKFIKNEDAFALPHIFLNSRKSFDVKKKILDLENNLRKIIQILYKGYGQAGVLKIEINDAINIKFQESKVIVQNIPDQPQYFPKYFCDNEINRFISKIRKLQEKNKITHFFTKIYMDTKTVVLSNDQERINVLETFNAEDLVIFTEFFSNTLIKFCENPIIKSDELNFQMILDLVHEIESNYITYTQVEKEKVYAEISIKNIIV